MKIDFKRENIKYIEIINRTITIKLENRLTNMEHISITLINHNQALISLMELIKTYDLIPVSESNNRQYILRPKN